MIQQAQIDLLGHLIHNPKDYYRNHSILKSGIFTGFYAEVFAYISTEFGKKGKIDTFALAEKFGETNTTPIVTAYCKDFYDAVNFLLEQRNKRILNDAVLSVVGKTTDESTRILEDALFAVKDLSSEKHVANLKEQVLSFREKVSRLGEGVTGLRTGFRKYDDFTSGLQPGELIFVAGETSQGKTSFALTMVKNIVEFGGKALVLSLEMSVDQLIARIVSQSTGVSSKRILSRNIDEGQLSQVNGALDEIEPLPLYIHDCTGSDVNYIIDTIRKYKMIKDVDVVMIDYLQLVANHEKYMNKEQQVGAIARKLKNVTKELHLPIICLSQLSRNASEPKPKLSRLRDSGQIEEAADQVIFIYRPEMYGIHTFEEDGMPTDGKAEIMIAKGRNVGTAMFRMDFVPYLTLFRDEQEYFSKNIINPSDDAPF